MKKMTNPFLLLIVVIFTAWGCEKESFSQKDKAIDIKTVGDLEFVYQVTDMEGAPKAVYQEGENILFSFNIQNNGEDTVTVCECYIPINFDDFFKVYRVFTEEGRDQVKEVGKPYAGAGGHLSLPITELKEKSNLGYQIPWIAEDGVSYAAPNNNTYYSGAGGGFAPNENDPLPKGDYFSGFTLQYNDQEVTFEVLFTVQ